MRRLHALDGEAERIGRADAPPRGARRDQAEDPALPGVMEHRLARLDLDRAEAVHPAHVVQAVHHQSGSPSLRAIAWNACWSRRVTGPGSPPPIGRPSTWVTAITSAPVPERKHSSAV